MSYSLNTDIDARRTAREIRDAIDKWPGAEFVSIVSNADLMDEKAVVVFDFNGNRVRVEHGAQHNYRSNLRAIYLTIDALRMAYKRGLGDVMTSTVSQMLALPGAAYVDPYELLGVRPDTDLEDIEAMYKIKAKRVHPDKGGTPEQMAQLNAAIEKVRADRVAT